MKMRCLKSRCSLRKKKKRKKRECGDNLIYTCEKTIREAGDKIKPEEKKEVENKINSLKEAQKGDNIEEIKTKTQDLSATIQKIGAELYKQQPQQNPQDKPKDGGAEEGKYTEK